MLCPKCNADNPAGAIFCNQCGKKLASTQKRRTKSRGNGTGTAFKRGKTWTAQVVYDRIVVADDKPLKKLTRSKGGFKTRDEALRYCPILKNGPQKPKQTPILEYYWNAFKKGPYTSLSKSTQHIYNWAWSQMNEIHRTSIDQLMVSNLQDVINKMDTYHKAKRCKNLLSNLYKIAAADGYVSKDITSLVTLPTLVESERTPFSDTEQTALWKLFEAGDIRAGLPLLMIYTGMMPGEAMQLKVENIDLQSQTITGVGMKTKVRKETPIVLANMIIPVVEKLIENARPDGYLWPNYRKNFCKIYYDALEAAKVRKLSPYSCRHTTATALAITKNIAPQTVQKVMRWSSTRMLDRYAHPNQQDALEAVNAL